MKTLIVRIHAEIEIPDNYEIVEHPSGIQVLKVGDRYVDFDIAPLVTQSLDPEAVWTDEEESLASELLNAVTGIETDLEVDAA